MTNEQQQQRLARAIVRGLMDEGRLIEAGFALLRAMAIPPDAPPVQIDEMRKSFFAGAQHLWGSLFSDGGGGGLGLDPDAEPTAGDMRRMELINAELTAFAKELEQELG